MQDFMIIVLSLLLIGFTCDTQASTFPEKSTVDGNDPKNLLKELNQILDARDEFGFVKVKNAKSKVVENESFGALLQTVETYLSYFEDHFNKTMRRNGLPWYSWNDDMRGMQEPIKNFVDNLSDEKTSATDVAADKVFLLNFIILSKFVRF